MTPALQQGSGKSPGSVGRILALTALVAVAGALVGRGALTAPDSTTAGTPSPITPAYVSLAPLCPDSMPAAIALESRDTASATSRNDTVIYVPPRGFAERANIDTLWKTGLRDTSALTVWCTKSPLIRRFAIRPDTFQGIPATLAKSLGAIVRVR